MIFHIPRIRRVINMIVLAFKGIKKRFWRLADGIDQHIQAPAMRHANDDVFNTCSPGALH